MKPTSRSLLSASMMWSDRTSFIEMGWDFPRMVAQDKKAEAVINDPPHAAFWDGYTGSFQDPDGHLWEVARNPD